MEFLCKKDCFMEGFPDEQVFTAGKKYREIQYSSEHGHRVMDDEHEWNWIGFPGEKFFDEYFGDETA
ncbi:MAG: hypothetical protein JW882_09940 [Deltaproteobacteria bacterium]|nr:hypothetical protein [Deltaproteobacteria bacterium]